MKRYGFYSIALVLLLMFSVCADAQTGKRKTAKKRVKAKVAKPVAENPPPKPEDFNIIAEGAQSKVEEPFLFVARDAKTYALLKNLAEELPDVSTIDFTKESVVAAFAGAKPTSGYGVQIRKANEKVVVEVTEPHKDLMKAQVITTPYKIAVVPSEEETALPLEVSATWTGKMKFYRLTRGSNFSYAGGFAFRERRFDAEGTVGVLTYGDLATLSFSMTAKGDRNLSLAEIASGSFTEGKIELNRLDAGTFSEFPRPSLNVSGTISDEKIFLRFEPNPTNTADGFQARGRVEAAKID
jgi:hypothetical protein